MILQDLRQEVPFLGAVELVEMKKTNREEDLDLQSLTDEELEAVWTAWLYQAQITNDEDRYTYSHGVFTLEPVVREDDVQSA